MENGKNQREKIKKVVSISITLLILPTEDPILSSKGNL